MNFGERLLELREAASRAPERSTRAIVLDRLGVMLQDLEDIVHESATPARTRDKIQNFLGAVEKSATELGPRLHHSAFALNVVGDAMAAADLISKPVVEFLQVGLYFFGLEQIEKRWSARAAVYSGIHADYLQEFLDRDSLKRLLEDASGRRQRGKIFCLTWSYLNSLRKAYWKHCRASEDAMDVALAGEVPSDRAAEPITESVVSEEKPESTDRVAMVLGVFQNALSARQRWIYLAKNRSLAIGDVGASSNNQGALDPLSAWRAELESTLGDSDLGWTEIATKLGINEKTAKREYLKSLHVLLSECSTAVFGAERIPSHYVRRVLETIRSIVYEKDLRLKDNIGRGLNTLVEKWEVALRFVLNHQRISA